MNESRHIIQWLLNISGALEFSLRRYGESDGRGSAEHLAGACDEVIAAKTRVYIISCETRHRFGRFILSVTESSAFFGCASICFPHGVMQLMKKDMQQWMNGYGEKRKGR
jgi:hypothetical protein